MAKVVGIGEAIACVCGFFCGKDGEGGSDGCDGCSFPEVYWTVEVGSSSSKS